MGHEWITTTAPFTNWSSVACSSDANKIAASVLGGGIYLSPDFGGTWTKSPAPDGSWSCIAVSKDGSRILAGMAGNGIWSSTDGGATWRKTEAPSAQWYSIAMSDSGADLIAACDVQVYLSKDSGASWNAANVLTPQGRYWRLVTISSDGQRMAAAAEGGAGVASVSSDNGTHWIETTSSNWKGLAESSDGIRLTIANCCFGYIYSSFDSGTSWIKTKAPVEYWGPIASSADGSHLIALGGHIFEVASHPMYVSGDNGMNWVQIDSPARLWLSAAISENGKRFVAIANGEGIYTWEPMRPVITLHPLTQVVAAGTNLTLQVTAGFGARPFEYQWQFNGVTMDGETNAALYLSNVTDSREGAYSVVIRNGFDSATSSNGALFVEPSIITAQPSPIDQTVPGGVDISFNVTAVSMSAISYQWLHNGTNMIDATNSVLTLHHVSLADTGSYLVQLSNSYGSINSRAVSLTVVPAFVNTVRQDCSPADAILNARITPGLNDTIAWFEWGPTTNVELRTPPVHLPLTANSLNFTALITNLVPYANYYYRAVASNVLGKVTGYYYEPVNYSFRAVPRLVETEGAPQAYWSSIACSSNGACVIASSNPLIYVSTNYGQTWKSVSAPIAYWGPVASSADGRRLFAVAGGGPIYASADYGGTWHAYGDSRPWGGLACSADGSTLVASSDLVFISRDAGATWQQTAMPSGPWRSPTISADGQRMAASRWSGFWREAGTIWTSLDSGVTWKQASSLQAADLVASGDGSKLWANSSGLVPASIPWISTNWGLTWTPLNIGTVYCAATTYDGKKWFTRSGNFYDAMLCSNDGGVTWGYSDDNDLSAKAIACSADAESIYVLRFNSIRMWQEGPPGLAATIGNNATVVSWPSYYLSSRLQESFTLNRNDWTDIEAQPTLTANRMFEHAPGSLTDKAFYRLRMPR